MCRLLFYKIMVYDKIEGLTEKSEQCPIFSLNLWRVFSLYHNSQVYSAWRILKKAQAYFFLICEIVKTTINEKMQMIIGLAI